MKRAVAFVLSLLLSLPLSAAQVVNRTLATVNGEPILQSEFEKTYAALTEDMPDTVPAEAQRDNKKKLLENLIDQKLLLQEAKKRKIRITQRDLETGMIQVKARFLPQEGQRAMQRTLERMAGENPQAQQEGPDLGAAWNALKKDNPAAVAEAEKQFAQELTKEGLTGKKFEDRIRDQLMANQLTQMEVRGRMKPPTEAEVKALYDRLMQVLQGKKAKPEDGDLGELAQYFSAKTGEKVRASHILVRVPAGASMMDKATALKKAKDLRKRIKDGADFDETARKFSDDKPSAAQGGNLGVLVRGQTVPDFEKAAFSLPVGQLSDVVESEFGYHIILVEEKKAAGKLRYEDSKEDLADYLMNAQGREKLMGFVQELRKSATIKMNVDNLDELGKK